MQQLVGIPGMVVQRFNILMIAWSGWWLCQQAGNISNCKAIMFEKRFPHVSTTSHTFIHFFLCLIISCAYVDVWEPRLGLYFTAKLISKEITNTLGVLHDDSETITMVYVLNLVQVEMI